MNIRTRIAARLRALAARLDPPAPHIGYGALPITAYTSNSVGHVTITSGGWR